jgi:hypothetical protein
MQARFRADYPGEFVVLNTTWSGGRQRQQREWIENLTNLITLYCNDTAAAC